MHNFKKYMYPVLFLAVILCINEILVLALKPYTSFRNDMHKLETNQYDDLFVCNSHVKAGINPEIVDKITSSIRQTAASGSHFSKMLTPEEEKIMREIIREFMG